MPHDSQLFGFDAAFLQKLERLALMTRRRLAGTSAGPHRSPRRGASVEFADFRDYSEGDDFRRVDWKAYARLERLFLRLYTAEEMTTLSLFLDHSASMKFGEPAKALMAARLAAIFSFVALHAYDRVAVAGWGNAIDRYLPAQSGTTSIPRVWSFIADVSSAATATTDLAALRSYGRFRRGSGLALVLTDLLSDSDWQSGLRGLQACGQEVSLLQILAPEELNPSVRGDWKLLDTESGAEVEVSISPRLLRRYQEELARHTEAIRDFCRRQGIAFLQISSDAPVGDTVLTSLRAAGMLA